MRNRLTDELAVCGFHAVTALGEVHPEKINRLFLREDRAHAFGTVCKQLAERKRPYKICDNEELERICKSSHHQGVVAMMLPPDIQPASEDDIADWVTGRHYGLVLQDIGNDHNLGAIIRSAAFFGAKYLIIAGESEDEEHLSGADLITTSCYRVAEGGMEYLTIRTVRNGVAFLKALSRGVWTVGTELRARQRIDNLENLIGYADLADREGPPPPLAIVLGNEEDGLPKEVLSQCRLRLRVPGSGNIESLNVAQAATIFLQKLYSL
ncbi:MAG: RNA methyltransferase [Spirochaetaceae bacterium]|jgi:TrmH RNA methyltransferase|nr:RNA methyltransferase [Spirochaetaceae bacterium]